MKFTKIQALSCVVISVGVQVELTLCGSIRVCNFYWYRPKVLFLLVFAYVHWTNLHGYNISISSIYQYVHLQLHYDHWINSFQFKFPNELFIWNQVIWWSLYLHAPKPWWPMVSFTLGEQKNKMYSYSKSNISVQALSQYLFYSEWSNVGIPNGLISFFLGGYIKQFHSGEAIFLMLTL